MTGNNIAVQIMSQLVGESGAIQEYEKLIGLGVLKEEDVKVIQEIIADEKNHSVKLMAMTKRYDGIVPSQDDLQEALGEIGKTN